MSNYDLVLMTITRHCYHKWLTAVDNVYLLMLGYASDEGRCTRTFSNDDCLSSGFPVHDSIPLSIPLIYSVYLIIIYNCINYVLPRL